MRWVSLTRQVFSMREMQSAMVLPPIFFLAALMVFIRRAGLVGDPHRRCRASASSFLLAQAPHMFKLSGSSRKSNRPMVRMPSSSIYGLMTSLTTTIFLKLSPMPRSDRFSCAAFSGVSNLSAD